ncbi:CoA transferase [Nakamurella antarctica]|uniref:CoA transferase n=1 Tax=Nakamurella antarctica TaxID=1902245 RepID=A0A3G8ZMG8_9ACTN|nr:CoA transferase [Nakamurella antarctica]AZI58443.1 CoA transferase [Nakamurella antarctica]
MSTNVSRPLDGLRVIDLSQMLAGPICAMRLGDLGADVIKVEPPAGEWTRTHPFANARVNGESTALLGLNRNKRSVVINVKDPEALEVLHELIGTADVVLQNFRVGTAERLGIGYEQIAERHPHIVYCQISGYGEDGPYRDRPGQDLLVQGVSGSMWSVGSRTDPPLPGALWAVDAMTGYQAAIGILSAIRERDKTGLGQKVSVDMWSVVMDCQTQEFTTYLNCDILPERSEEQFAHAWTNPPYGTYKTKDSYIVLSQLPIDVLGEAVDDDRLRAISSWDEAEERRDEIRRILLQIMPTRTTAEWLEVLYAAKLWAGPVYTYADIEADPHVKARGMISTISHPTIGELRLPSVPIRFSRSTADIRVAPPLLGQHTEELLEEIGISAATRDALRERGSI